MSLLNRRKALPNVRSCVTRAVTEAPEGRLLLSAQLLKDINTMRTSVDFLPGNIAAAGSVAYFTDDDGSTGEELWKTDGTTAGTKLLKDIYPGAAGSFPGGYTSLNGITYFDATDPVDGAELWRTDGTSAGTYLVKDIDPGSGSSNPFDFTVYNGSLYFTATDGVHGRELWKSDGTATGTSMVVDTDPGSSGQANPSSTFHRIVVTGANVLVYTAYDGTNTNLYTINGSGPITFVKQLAYSISSPGLLAGSGNLVFYSDLIGYVYQSDGTSAGTVTDDATNSNVNGLTVAGNNLYYVRAGSIKCVGGGYIQQVTLSPQVSPVILGAQGTNIYFSVTQSGTPQVWYSYGGGQYSGLILNNAVGTAGTAVDNLFYFVTGSSTAGYSLYKVASPPSAVVFVTNINAGGSLTAPSGLTAFGSKLLFINSDSTNGTQPWVSDGTAAGTALLKSIYPGTAGSTPFMLGVVNGKVFFSANDGITGTELYVTDGTTAGTYEVKDINPGINSSSPTNTIVIGSKLYFTAYDPTDGSALWASDGTAAGTTMLSANTSGSASPSVMGSVNGWILFSANDPTHGTELWRTDGTAADTQLLYDINPGTGSSNPSRTRTLNGYAYFTATDTTHGTELWRTDGTAAGTSLVDDIYPGSSSSNISSLFVYNNMLLFSAQSSSYTGSELWESDGTAAGTVLVKDIYPGASSSSPSGFALYNGEVYFSAKDATATGLWVTDGTAAGTQLVAEDNPVGLVATNGKLYFLGSAIGQSADYLYVTQGTPATTQPVSTTPGSILNSLTAIDGRLFFIGDDGSGSSYELWTSDGTAAGTAMVQDLFPGSFEGASAPLENLNGAIVFRGDNGVSGTEVYEFPDIYAPELSAASVTVAAAAYTIHFSFSENVSANLSAASLQLQDLTTGQNIAVAGTGYSYNASTDTASFTLPPAALLDGRYRATIAAGLLVDPNGNVATAPATLEFLSVAGTAGDDSINILPSPDGTSLQVYKNRMLTFTTPLASLGSVVVTGGSGNDSLTITLGASMPAGGFSYDGGSGSNLLAITGTSGAHAVSSNVGMFSYDSLPIGFINSAPVTFDLAGGNDSISNSTQLQLASALGAGRTISALNLTGTLDVNNDSLDLPGSSLSTITAEVQAGYNAGNWNGTGLTSSAALNDSSHLTSLGSIQNNQSGAALFSSSRLFDGVAPGLSDILLKYTYYGDANLDGKVDGTDYSRIDSGSLNHLTGWFNGDFNYDGIVNGSDYTLIDNAYNTQGVSLAAQIHSQATASIKRKTSMFSTLPTVQKWPRPHTFESLWGASASNSESLPAGVAAQIFDTNGDSDLKFVDAVLPV